MSTIELDSSVSPVIAEFISSWSNDLDNGTRDKLKSYFLKAINSKGTLEQEHRRAWMCCDWLCRTLLPAFLSLNPTLKKHAENLAAFPEITDPDSAGFIQTELAAALYSASSYAASLPTDFDALAAAWDATLDSAWCASLNAARTVAWDCAWDVAWASAWAAARDSDSLQRTAAEMQASAFKLLDRMISIRQEDSK